MPNFSYTGYNARGKLIKGFIDAESIKEAKSKLRKSGVFAVEVKESFKKISPKREISNIFGSVMSLFQRVSVRELSAFTREFGTLLRAGLPVVEALSSLVEQFDNPYLKHIISDVRDKIMEGLSLADALRQHKKVFSDLYVSMVAAGEASGTLEGILFSLADYLDEIVRFRSKVVTIAIYPSIVFTVMIGVLVILLGFVIPRVSKIFEDLGQSLPVYTKIIIGVSHFITNYWMLILSFLILLYIGYRFYKRTETGKKQIDKIKLQLPIIGKFTRLAITSRLTRTLATLLKGGVSILKAIDITENVVTNMVLKEALRSAKESISGGSGLAEPLKNSGVFPPVVIHMVSAGERSGELENMLMRVSEIFDQEIETMTNAFIAVLEPLVVVLMAGMVLFIILSVLLPLLQMQQFIK